MAIETLYPAIRPSLNLDFANAKALDPRITFSRASAATYYDGKTVAKAEENLLLNSAILATQSVTTRAEPYTLSFIGTGTVTLSGTSTAGPLVGTGAANRVSLTFTPTAGTLTLTVTGAVEQAQLEARSVATAYTPTTTQPITNYIPVLQTAPAGVPRFDHNPLTGESLGLLIEEQRTNLLTYSSNPFDVATGVTAKENSGIVAPTGDIYQRLVELSGTSGGKILFNKNFNTDALSYTFSFYTKNYFGSRWIVFRENTTTGFSFYFRPSTGTFSSFSGGAHSGNCVAIPQADGGYRVCFTIAFTSTANRNFALQMAEVDGGQTIYAGNGTSGFLATSVQFEAGAFSTSYIKTEASQVTRAADSASMIGANFSSWYRQDEGTLLGVCVRQAGSYPCRIAYLSKDTNTSEFIGIAASNANGTSGQISRQSVAQFSAGSISAASGQYSVALAYKTDDSAFSMNGGSLTTDNSVLLPSDQPNRLGIGTVGAYQGHGHLKRIAYYPKRLTDAQLQALTA